MVSAKLSTEGRVITTKSWLPRPENWPLGIVRYQRGGRREMRCVHSQRPATASERHGTESLLLRTGRQRLVTERRLPATERGLLKTESERLCGESGQQTTARFCANYKCNLSMQLWARSIGRQKASFSGLKTSFGVRKTSFGAWNRALGVWGTSFDLVNRFSDGQTRSFTVSGASFVLRVTAFGGPASS